MSRRIAIGIGCRKDCYVSEIIELVHVALNKCDITITDVSVMATPWSKDEAEAVMHAADALDIPLLIIPKEKCDEISGLAETKGEKVVELFAIPADCEVAALAAVGKNAKLICPRITSPTASCAVAMSG